MLHKNIAPSAGSANRGKTLAARPKRKTISLSEITTFINPRLADLVEAWPELWFRLEDGRKFGLIFGRWSIVFRLMAMQHQCPGGAPKDAGLAVWLKLFVAGVGEDEVVIGEVGDSAPPLRFDTQEKGFDAWAELRKSFDGEIAEEGGICDSVPA